VYFGYGIGGGELKIDLAKMKAIFKWPVPTNVIEVRRFIGVAKYLHMFISSFLVVVVPLHAIKKKTISVSNGERISIKLLMS
jgi:hypothetical protein